MSYKIHDIVKRKILGPNEIDTQNYIIIKIIIDKNTYQLRGQADNQIYLESKENLDALYQVIYAIPKF
jgi:hypothetical protein